MLSFVYEHMTTWIRDEGYADNRFSPPDAISFRYVQKIAWDPTRWFNGRLWDTLPDTISFRYATEDSMDIWHIDGSTDYWFTLPDTISFRYATEDSMDIWHMTALRSVGSLFLTRFLFRDILGEEYMDWQMISLTDKTDSLFQTRFGSGMYVQKDSTPRLIDWYTIGSERTKLIHSSPQCETNLWLFYCYY